LSVEISDNALRCVDGLAWRRVDDDVYVFRMDGSLHVLEGGVSQFLWETLDSGEATHESLLKGMLSAFNVETEVAKNDLDEFLAGLLTAGLLVG